MTNAPGTLPDTQVRAMFDRIAGFYDLMNSVMTAGLHHRWRARAADLADVRPGDRVLDVATGTGDLAIELAKRIAPGGEVIGSDFSDGMLERAREKAPAAAVGARRRAGAALRRRRVPGRDGRLRRAELRRPREGHRGRWRGSWRPAARSSSSRSRRPRSHRCRRSSRLWFDRVIPLVGKVAADSQAYSVPPELRASVPRAGGTRGGARRRRADRRPVDPHRRRDHRPPRRNRTQP